MISNINRKQKTVSLFDKSGHLVSHMRLIIIIPIYLIFVKYLHNNIYFIFNWLTIFFLFSVVWSPLVWCQVRPPNLSPDNLPDTAFTCEDKVTGGYYADVEADCQLFHVCVQVSEYEVSINKHYRYYPESRAWPVIPSVISCLSCVVSISPWLRPSIHIHSRTLGKHCFGTFARLIMSL